MSEEIWKPIRGFEDLYEVSNRGRVRTIEREIKVTHWNRWQNITRTNTIEQKVISVRDNGNGYMSLTLNKNSKGHTKYIHRLIAEAFIPNPNDYKYINHKNGIKDDNRIANLEWCTAKQNSRHAIENGLMKRGEKHKGSVLTKKEVLEIRALWPLGWFTQKEIAEAYSVSRGCVAGIIHRANWKHI